MIEPKRQDQIIIFKYEMVKDTNGVFLSRKTATEAAKIAVNEILKTCAIGTANKSYWNEVKKELEL